MHCIEQSGGQTPRSHAWHHSTVILGGSPGLILSRISLSLFELGQCMFTDGMYDVVGSSIKREISGARR